MSAMHSAPSIFLRLWPSNMAGASLVFTVVFHTGFGRGLKEFRREGNCPSCPKGVAGMERSVIRELLSIWHYRSRITLGSIPAMKAGLARRHDMAVNASAPLSGSMDVHELWRSWKRGRAANTGI